MPSAFSTTNTQEADGLNLIHSETITVPGIYRMSEKAYHGDPAPTPSLSRSIAEKLILESPRHARAAHPRMTAQDETPETNSRTRDIGSATHAMLLGQQTEIAVLKYPDFKTGGARAHRAEVQERGGIPLLEKDFETATAMVEKARAVLIDNEHPAIRSIVDPDPSAVVFNEVTAAWIDRCGDKWARARMDRLNLAPKLVTILDYKTTELSVAPDAVQRAIYNNNYHFQDAFYRRGIRALLPQIDRHEMRLDFLFIMQEQEPPYEITVARVDAAGRVIGEKMASAAFLMWRKCHAENWWPGYPGEIVTAEMPAYVDTRWTSKEIEDPHLQGLGHDPMPFYETQPYRPTPITDPC
ncbi:PD-(D/E)XK nuclease-like domain-containing protein [Agrobacterium sp. M50-1]|uniref:PD-(D/E)XK nuclease-like domain-containing protein n=1 Tax=Agrobacterium sp. M50-1 TaxID=3132821 RepID=UPI003CE4CAE5